MFNFLKKADPRVKTGESWVSAFGQARDFWTWLVGGGSVMAGIFGWLWSYIDAVAKHGWAAIVIACIFAVPLALMAIAGAVKAYDSMATRFGWKDKTKSEALPATPPEGDTNATSRARAETISEIEKRVFATESTISQWWSNIERDMSMLANLVHWELAIEIAKDALDIPIPVAPVDFDGMDDGSAKQLTADFDTYVKDVMHLFQSAPYQNDLSYAHQHGRSTGEWDAKAISASDRPSAIDQYVFLELMKAIGAARALREELERRYKDARQISQSNLTRAEEIRVRYAKSR